MVGSEDGAGGGTEGTMVRVWGGRGSASRSTVGGSVRGATTESRSSAVASSCRANLRATRHGISRVEAEMYGEYARQLLHHLSLQVTHVLRRRSRVLFLVDDLDLSRSNLGCRELGKIATLLPDPDQSFRDALLGISSTNERET